MEQFYKEEEDLTIELKEQCADMELELRTFKEPIRAVLIGLLRDDTTILHEILTMIEREVDNQCMGLKDEILEDLDYKIDEQFDGNAFKSAVDEHMRRKF
jgi:hypothetical protein